MDANCPKMFGVLRDQNLDTLQIPVLKKHGSGLIYKSKKRRLNESVEESGFVSNKWESMDPNLLRDIFRRISVVDLFINVSSVCQAWEATCWDFMFWSHKVLDMSATGAGFGMAKMWTVESLYPPQPIRAPGFFGKLDSQEKYNNMAVALMMKLRRILGERIPYCISIQSWRVSLTTVILPYDLEISDNHLIYIAERTPFVEHLLLLNLSKITTDGFIKALKCWKHLSGIHLGPIKDDSFAEFIKGIGTNCKEIESLHIHQNGYRLDEKSAPLIATSLPGLKKLELELGIVRPRGLATMYNMCLQLEEVYFNGCRREYEIAGMRDHPLRETFRLTWTENEIGFAKWQVTPCFCEIEKYPSWFQRETRYVKYASSPEFLENKKARLQPMVEEWMLDSGVACIRYPMNEERRLDFLVAPICYGVQFQPQHGSL